MKKHLIRAVALCCMLMFNINAKELKPVERDYLKVATQTEINRKEIANGNLNQIEIWFKPVVLTRWNDLTKDMLVEEQNEELYDFFQGSYILLGQQNSNEGIAALYNPWVDAILLLHLDNSSEVVKVNNFVFLDGETWRNEEGVNTSRKENLSVTIWRKFSESVSKFDTQYIRFQSSDFSKLLEVNQKKELKNIRQKTIARMGLMVKLFDGENNVVLTKIAALRKEIHKSEIINFKRHFVKNQNQVVLDSFVGLPHLIRKGMRLYAFIPTTESTLVAFVNPEMPRYISIFKIPNSGGLTMEWFDINDSSKLINAWDK